METLNALLKEAIPILDGITYTPQIITTDNTKGEVVVEIKIQKGAVRAAVNFTIVGFTTTSQVQADLKAALAKVGADTISGDENKLPSQMTPTLIKALTGFPKTTSNGVSFSVAIKSDGVDDAKGQLVIILAATKESESQTKELTISDFKTTIEAQTNQIAIANELKKGFTISADSTKLPSQMTLPLIKALTGFPITSNDVHFSVVIKSGSVDDDKGQLVIILTATKGSESQTKELTISGFKISAQGQANKLVVNNEIARTFTISANDAKLPSQMTVALIKALTGFPVPKANGVHFSVVIKKMGSFIDNKGIISFIDDGKGELEFTLIANKGKQSASRNISISGFKTREFTQEEKDIALFKKGVDIFGSGSGTINDDSKFADEFKFHVDDNNLSPREVLILIMNKTSLVNFDDLKNLPTGFWDVYNGGLRTPRCNFISIVDPQDDTIQIITITFLAIKGKATATSTIMISGFASRKQAQLDINGAKRLLDGFDANINSDAKTAAQVTYKDIKDFIAKTTIESPNAFNQTIIDQVIITIETSPKGDTSQSVTFTISKDGATSATSTIEISGFASQKLEDPKIIINELSKIVKSTITGDSAKFPSEMDSDSIKALSGFPPPTTSGVSFDVKVKTLTDTDGISTDISGTLIITLTGSKNGAIEGKELIISGFKKRSLSQYEKEVSNALAPIIDATITGDSTKLPSKMDSDSIKTLSGFPETTNGVSFAVKVKTRTDTNRVSTDISGILIITLTASKSGTTKSKELTISGFKTRPLSQDENDVANALDKITKATITGDSTNLPSKVNTPTLIKKLKGFPPTTNDVSFDVIVSTNTANDEEGTLMVTLIASKNGVKQSKDLTIEGFKSQVNVNQDIIDNYQKLIKKVSQTTTTKIKKLSSNITYDNSVASFNTQTNANLDLPPAHVNVAITTKNADGSQVVTFTITKGDASAKTHSITVSGFKTQAQFQAQSDIDKAKTFLDSLVSTRIQDLGKFATQVTYSNLQDLFDKTILSNLKSYIKSYPFLKRVKITIKAVPKGARSQTVTFTIAKTGGTSATSVMEVTNFRAQS